MDKFNLLKMNEEIIETIVIFLGSCWLFLKAYRKKNLRPLFLGVLGFTLLPSRWPFFLPVYLSFALMSFIAAAGVLYENFYLKKEKSQFIYTYLLLFLVFGAVFLVQAIHKMN